MTWAASLDPAEQTRLQRASALLSAWAVARPLEPPAVTELRQAVEAGERGARLWSHSVEFLELAIRRDGIEDVDVIVDRYLQATQMWPHAAEALEVFAIVLELALLMAA